MKYCLLFVISAMLFSCKPNIPNFNNIDMDEWQKDKNGCNEYRIIKISELKSGKEQLLRLSEVDVIKTLGKPDKAELIERSQKMYIYYLGKSQKCKAFNQTNLSIKIMSIRFNAMGYCNDLVIIDEKITG